VLFEVVMRIRLLLFHPDATAGILRHSIALRMSRNNSLGIATSAIWKITCQEWRTTFAPILINFSRNVARSASLLVVDNVKRIWEIRVYYLCLRESSQGC
jgi:hypothetical protein